MLNENIELIKFGAKWCWPCKIVDPIVDQFQKENLCKITLVDIDESPELAEKYDIQSIPHFIWLNNGEIVNSHSGIVSLRKLKTNFGNILNNEV